MRRNILLLCLLCLIGSCGEDPEPVNCDESDLSIQLNGVGNASSCSSSDGFIKVIASGGREPYQFSVNNLTFQASNEFTSLRAGIYSAQVMDADKCVREINNITVQAAGFSVAVDITGDNDCLGGSGSVTVNINEGEAPFLYKLGTGDFVSDNMFTGLQKGNHSITIKDNNDCTLSLNVTVPHGFTGTSWENEILPIVKSSCALSKCHDGIFQPDLRIYEKAKFYASDMKKFTQDRSMPFDGSITQSQIDLIACWVDDGALQN